MRILHTESSLGWGGQEIRILTEAAGMIDRGHKVALACGDKPLKLLTVHVVDKGKPLAVNVP